MYVSLPIYLRNEASYGTVVLILPTDFTGGDVLITYNDDDVKYQPEETAFEGCYYMAWYNNVKPKFYPVTEGNQLAISFSLTYDGTMDKATSEYLQKRRQEIVNDELSPAELEESKPYIDRAAAFFKGSAERPFPIFYMLDYRYASPSLQVDKLKRPDKILAKTLQKAADEAGFLMYLGSVEREVEGKVYEEGKPHDSNNTEEGDDCPIDEEGIYLTQKAIYDEYVLRKIYNEQGKNILNIPVGLDSSDHPSIIQGPIWYSRCKPSDVDYSGTVEVEDVTVKYYYSESQVNTPKLCKLLLFNTLIFRHSYSCQRQSYPHSLKCLRLPLLKKNNFLRLQKCIFSIPILSGKKNYHNEIRYV